MRTACTIVVLLLASPALAEPPAVATPLDSDGFRDVLVQTGNLYIAGQPNESGFKRLADAGVTTVINLRTSMEMDNRDIVPFDEAALLSELGLQYVHIPLGGPDTPYNPEAVDQFAAALEQAEGKVLLHCTVAWRASHLWTAYLVRHHGLALEDAVAHGRAINFGQLPIEGFLGKPLTLEYQ